MAPVKIKHVVSFTSEDPKHRVVNLCCDGERSSPWLCSVAERSGLLKADLQLDRAMTIHFIDVGNHGSAFIQVDVGRSSWSVDHPYVTLLPTTTLMSPADSRQGTGKHTVRMFKKGDFMPQAAEEDWDRLRVTCSQPFNKRDQFGLAFFRVRTADDEHTEESSTNQEKANTKNQRTPDKVRSVREWISSPSIQHTFFSQNTGESSPGEPTKNYGKLSRAELMVTAAQSVRRSQQKSSCNALINSPARREKGRNPQHGLDRTPEACRRKSETVLDPAIMSSTPKRSRGSTSDLTAIKKKNSTFRHSPVKSHIPATSSKNSPEYPEPPETVCPICGVSFSPDYLPLHASSCLDSDSTAFSHETDRESASFTLHTPSGPSTDEFMVPCPLCSLRFPTDCIQQHASTCGDTLWVD